MGPYPEELQFKLYNLAIKKVKDLKVVFNLGNNDFGYREADQKKLLQYRKSLNKDGVQVISTNTFLRNTNMHPEGVKPYTIIESANDNLLYLGFAPEVTQNKELFIKPALQTIEEISPDLRNIIKENNVKGIVILLHDGMKLAQKIQEKIQKLGMDLKFIIGGHIHETPQAPNIIFPKPFAMGANIFDLNIDRNGSAKILNNQNISSSDFRLADIYQNIINPIEEREGFQREILPNIRFDLPFSWETPKTAQTAMGTVYANGIKNITGSDIGLVRKGWIWRGLNHQETPLKKIELLFSLKRPEPKIKTVELTTSELKNIIEEKMHNNDYIHELSSNVNLIIDTNAEKAKQIYVNNSKLLDANGNPISDNQKISCAIDYFSISKKNFDAKESKYSMYDGFLHKINKINNDKNIKELIPNKFKVV